MLSHQETGRLLPRSLQEAELQVRGRLAVLVASVITCRHANRKRKFPGVIRDTLVQLATPGYMIERYHPEKDPVLDLRANHEPLPLATLSLEPPSPVSVRFFRQAHLAIILTSPRPIGSRSIAVRDIVSGDFDDMSDFGHFGGSDEEYATVRKHNAEVVSLPRSRSFESRN